MVLGLGIDTGGTFTDAAVVDLDSKKVLAKAKAPTTYHDLSIGIASAVDQVIQLGGFDAKDILLVGLSTTLATNSIQLFFPSISCRGKPDSFSKAALQAAIVVS